MDLRTYIRFIEREQERVGAVFRDRASLAARGLSPSQLILEHAGRVADNLVWDGSAWRLHMHLGPYGNGLLFDVVVSETGALVDLARPMAEQFPVTSWESIAYVDLAEVAARSGGAPEIAGELLDAARRLALGVAENREALQARIAAPPVAIDKVAAFPAFASDGHRSLAVLNFDAPLALAGDFAVERVAGDVVYRTPPLLYGRSEASGLAPLLARHGVVGADFTGALERDALAISADPASSEPIALRIGTGIVGAGARLQLHRIARGAAVDAALRRVVRDRERLAWIREALRGTLCWTDAGRNVYAVRSSTADAATALPLETVLKNDPDAWWTAIASP